MRYSASEKLEIIRLVEGSSLSVRQTLRRLDINKSSFYNWLKRYQDDGVDYRYINAIKVNIFLILQALPFQRLG